jgi:hypothetical protein
MFSCEVPVILVGFYISLKYSNTKLHGNMSGESRTDPCGQTDRRTNVRIDMTKLIIAFGNFANAPEDI